MGVNGKNKVSLSRRLFLYLIGVTLLAVFTLGFFWLEEKIVRYKKDVEILRQTYSEKKKDEIQTRILKIKENMLWIQHSMKKPIAYTLSKQVEAINLPEDDTLTPATIRQLIDSISESRVPVTLFDNNGRILFDYTPFYHDGSEPNSPIEERVFDILKKSDRNKEKATIFGFDSNGDSVIVGAGYIDKASFPGVWLASVVDSSHINNILDIYLLDSISKLRFEENEYIFVNDMDGRALVTHGRYNNPPMNILSNSDTAWVTIYNVEKSSEMHPEGVFYKYTWPLLVRPGSSGKTSYFSYIPGWDWVIGMGFYEDDVIKDIASRKRDLLTELQKTIIHIVIFVLFATLICFILVRYFSFQFNKNLLLFTDFFDRAGKDNIMINSSQVSYREFGFMADMANKMVEEKMQIEDALKESEMHYRYLFERNPVPLLIYEVGKLKILSVNDAFTMHYGYTLSEALTMTLEDLCPENERERVKHQISNLAGQASVNEWHNVKKDGTIITVEITSHGFIHEGHTSRIVVINDITSRKRIEAEIRNVNSNLELKVDERTALLESANKELEAFSYSVSHDLRAPLRHINGFLELLNKNLKSSVDEKGRHYLQSISKAATHMGLLIDSLLNFSRTGRMEMILETIDMNQVLQEALSILEQEVEGREIEWHISSLPDAFADYAMIRQVWVNLLGNAIKYTRKQTRAVIEVGSFIEDNECIYFVHDNGTGFDMNYSQKLFGVFQRLHTNDEFEGTGIGLANVRQVIKRHKGRTWAQGEVDRGATFYFSIPLS